MHYPFNTRWLPVFALLLVMLLVGACVANQPLVVPADSTATAVAEPAPDQPAATDTTTEADTPETQLINSTWSLQDYRDEQSAMQPAAAEATLAFTEGEANGNAGCNQFFAPYVLSGDSLTFGPAGSTMMACEDPRMAQEQAMLGNLALAASFRITGDQLEILDQAGETLLSFARQASSETRSPETSPVGSTWQWLGSFYSEQDGLAVDDPSKYTLTLLPDGKVDLKIDCNLGGGNYTLQGAALTLEVATMTRVACPEGTLSDTFIGDLSRAATFALDGSELVITLADGGTMRFQPALTVASVTAPGMMLSPDQLSIDAGAVADSAQWQIVPAVPYSESMPLLTGAPEHLALTFNGETLDEATFAGRAFYVVPLADYAALWNNAGNPFITLHTDELKLLLADQPAQPNIQTGLLLPSPLASDVVAQPAYLELPGLDATVLRWVGRLPQDLMPLVNNDLRYLVEGLSNDGRYYITGSFPISTATLPDSLDTLSEDEQAAFDQDPQGVLEAASTALSFLNPADFTPSLDALDAMLQSITAAGGITVSGVVTPTETLPLSGTNAITATETAPLDGSQSAAGTATAPLSAGTLATQGTLAELGTQPWNWLAITTPDGAEQATPTPNRYQISFFDSGAVRILADCNRGGGTHRLSDDSISITVQSMTRAACRKDSLSLQYLNYLGQAASWAVQNGDLMITLQDGSVMHFTPAR
ncbi:MAG: META domain-containing protein [Caldilineales bacterium]